MLTEDRKTDGLLLEQSVRVNASLAAVPTSYGFIDLARERERTSARLEELQARYRHLEQPAGELSGGNQQKSLIARWLLREPRILIFDEPTRGIDAGARAEIHQLLAGLADSGSAVLLVSSDLRELTTISDRIAVLSKGRLVATFEGPTFDPAAIMTAAFSSHVTSSASPSPGRADHA